MHLSKYHCIPVIVAIVLSLFLINVTKKQQHNYVILFAPMSKLTCIKGYDLMTH